MHLTANRLNKMKKEEGHKPPPFFLQQGFTLIELMMVVAIIGILASIATSQYFAYLTKSSNAAALNDLRNLMTNEEAYFTNSQTYYGSYHQQSGAPAPVPGLEGSLISKGVGYSVLSFSSDSKYSIYTGHTNGDTSYGGSDTGLMRFNKFTDKTNPRVSAASENSVLTSAWGTGYL